MFPELSADQVDDMFTGIYGGSRQQNVERFFTDMRSKFESRTRQLVPESDIFSIDIGYASRKGKNQFYFTVLSPTEGNDGISARTIRCMRVRTGESANPDFKQPAAIVTYRKEEGAYVQEMLPWDSDTIAGSGPARPGFIYELLEKAWEYTSSLQAGNNGIRQV